MEKRKRIETQLPEEMIQHVQSFLSGKEAARTTILSKSWYNAWLTRPNLVFDYRNFPPRIAFVEFVKKTLQRYDELNQKIHSLKLTNDGNSYMTFLENELLVRAMKLGATDLDIDLTRELRSIWTHYFFVFVLPREVLESETLVRFSLYNCKIDLHDRKINCSRLKYLRLSNVWIEGGNIWDIISTCPSIENLVLSDVYSNTEMVVMKPGLCVDKFHKLRVLLLEKMGDIGEWCFDGVSRFPRLEELIVNDCRGDGEIQICSDSLECISFVHRAESMFRVEFDVPKIRKLKFSGDCVPPFCFKRTSKEWESDIFIGGFQKQGTLFREMREFMLDLSPSKIYLSLEICLVNSLCDYTHEDIIPRVEKLRLFIKARSSFHSAILENLFWSCRPNLITLYWSSYPYLPLHFPYYWEQGENNDLTKLICNTLMKKVSDHENRNIAALPFLRSLEEVNFEFFENDVAGRRRLHWKTLSEALANAGKIRMEVCLQLKWGESF